MSIIDTDDAKQHLNVTGSDDDILIMEKIRVAEQWIEKFTGKALADYGEATPAPLREAARQIVAHLYENREATLIGVTGEELPFGVRDLLAPYREYVF